MYFHTCECGARVEAVARPGMCCPRCGRELVAPATDGSTDQTTGAVSEEPPRREGFAPGFRPGREAQLLRQIDGLTSNTARSLELLRERLTLPEQEQLRRAVERGQATTKTLEDTVHELEQAAVIIGTAMLRPPR